MYCIANAYFATTLKIFALASGLYKIDLCMFCFSLLTKGFCNCIDSDGTISVEEFLRFLRIESKNAVNRMEEMLVGVFGFASW